MEDEDVDELKQLEELAEVVESADVECVGEKTMFTSVVDCLIVGDKGEHKLLSLKL